MKLTKLIGWLCLAHAVVAIPRMRLRQVSTGVNGCTCPVDGLTTTTLVRATEITTYTTLTVQSGILYSTDAIVTRYTVEFTSTTIIATGTVILTRPGVTQSVTIPSTTTITVTASTPFTTCLDPTRTVIKRQITAATSAASAPSEIVTTLTVGSRPKSCVCRLVSPLDPSACICSGVRSTVTVSSISTNVRTATVLAGTPVTVSVTPEALSTITIPSLFTSSTLVTVESTQLGLTITTQSLATVFFTVTPTVISCPQTSSSTSTSTSTTRTSTLAALAPLATSTFVCNATAYQIGATGSGPVNLYNIDLSTGRSIEIATGVGGSTYSAINALGYNTLDNFLYAVAVLPSPSGTYAIIRLSAEGVVRQISTFTASAQPTSGDIDTDGQFYFTANGSAWGQVNLAPGTANYGKVVNSGTSVLNGYSVFDWSYLPGQGEYMYSLAESTDSTPNFAVLRWSLSAHTWSVVRAYPTYAAPNLLVANWGGNNGTLWGLAASTGQLTRVAIGGEPVAIGIGVKGLDRGDGARCGLAS